MNKSCFLGGEDMNSEKILNAIPKLQKLTEKQLDMVDTAINAFLLVQTIESIQESSYDVQQLFQQASGNMGIL